MKGSKFEVDFGNESCSNEEIIKELRDVKSELNELKTIINKQNIQRKNMTMLIALVSYFSLALIVYMLMLK
ncbi:hypothetical protein [Vibrio sp. NH-UV-68]|uniref:hypothetical protein n=1 Tax=unclassified Vibrio TaxID=2614977 RepID=UPI0036F29CC3